MFSCFFKKVLSSLRAKKFFTLNDTAQKVVSFKGCNFFAGKSNKLEAALLRSQRDYDEDNFSLIEAFVKPGHVCFDVGANIGIYSVVLSRLSGSVGNVHSFEPVNHIRKKLIKNMLFNGFSTQNVNDFALGEAVSTEKMFQVKTDLYRGGTSSFVQNDTIEKIGVDNFDVCDVSVQRLDDYVQRQEIKKIDFMKIDVEGFEWQVLQGGHQTIQEHKPAILIEYEVSRHSEADGVNEFKKFFDQYNYTAYEFKSFGGELVMIPFEFDKEPVQRNIFCLYQG